METQRLAVLDINFFPAVLRQVISRASQVISRVQQTVGLGCPSLTLSEKHPSPTSTQAPQDLSCRGLLNGAKTSVAKATLILLSNGLERGDHSPAQVLSADAQRW